MKKRFLSFSSLLALLLCLGAGLTAEAQTRDKYLISAKAGGINFVAGNVTVSRSGTGGQLSLTEQDNLEDGDQVTTGVGGRVEVLLNPGSYLRVGENSEFEMTDTSLDHLRIKLLRGSAIIEVVGTDDTTLSLKVETPQTSAAILRRGIYRFNVFQSYETEVLVQKGRALVGPMAVEVKSGKMVTVTRGIMSPVVKIQKRPDDSLALWSRQRAEYLAQVNRQIQPRILRASIFDYSAEYNTEPIYYRNRHSGSWVYDSQRNCYVFVPGQGGSSSPYGYNYPNWGGRACNCINGAPANNPNPPGVPGGGGGGGGTIAGGGTGGGGGDNGPQPTNTPSDGGPSRQPSNDSPAVVSRPDSAPQMSAPPSPPPAPAPPPAASSPGGAPAVPVMRENPN